MITNEILASLNVVIPVLEKHSVDVIIIGGTAVAYYGYQRVSGGLVKGEIIADLDFWYKPTIENYYNLIKALKDLNIDTDELENRTFNPQKSFLKIPHKTFHTDFLPVLEGLESFKECKKNCSTLAIGNYQVNVIGLNDLIMNKNAVNRIIDRNDVRELKSKRDQGMSF